jgi:hypothetical protein
MSAALGLVFLLSVGSVELAPSTTSAGPADLARLTSFEFVQISSPQHAGDSFDISILAKDENGNPYPYIGSALLSTTIGAYVQPTNVQFYNGICQPRVVVTLADSLALRCFTDSANGTSNVFDVLPDTAQRLVVILPGEQLAPGSATGRIGIPATHTAGDTFVFDVYATDGWFNPVPGRDDSVYFTSDDRFAGLPAGGQLSGGTGTFAASIRAAGLRHLYSRPAAGSGLRGDTSSVFAVAAGPFSEMLLVAPGESLLPGDTDQYGWQTPGKSGTPTPQFVRTPFDVVVYPCDRCWNRVVGPGDTINVGSDFAIQAAPDRATLVDSALFTVQFNNPGSNQNIWARDWNTGAETYRTHIDVRAKGAILEVYAPDTVRAGETTYIRVVVRDANATPIVATLVQAAVIKGSGTMIDQAMLTDTLGLTTLRFLCTAAHSVEQDSVHISSGDADTTIGIYINHLSDSLFAFPNPFGWNQDRTLISYYLQRSAPVDLAIYDPFGNEVWTQHYRQNEPGAKSGDNRVYWNGRNNQGRRVASGVYVINVVARLHTGIDTNAAYRIGVVW